MQIDTSQLRGLQSSNNSVMSNSNKVGLVVCAPVMIGEEVVGCLQCVSSAKERLLTRDEENITVFSKVIGYTLMMLKVGERLNKNEEIMERINEVSESKRGLQFLFVDELSDICDDLIKLHVVNLLKGRTDINVTLFVTDKETTSLGVCGKGKGGVEWPKMEINGTGSLVGRSGYYGVVQQYNNKPAAVGATAASALAGGLPMTPSKLATSTYQTPSRVMRNLVDNDDTDNDNDNFTTPKTNAKELNREYGTKSVCIPIAIPFNANNAQFGVLNKRNEITVGVLRVANESDSSNFSDVDIEVLVSYSSQLATSLCSFYRRKLLQSKSAIESKQQHKRDKKVAYVWKKQSDNFMGVCEKLGELTGDLMGLLVKGKRDESAAAKDEELTNLVVNKGMEMLGFDTLAFVTRASSAESTVLQNDGLRDFVMQAMRRGVVIRNNPKSSEKSTTTKGKEKFVICAPIWQNGYGPPCGVLVGVRNNAVDGAFAGSSEENLFVSLANVLGNGLNCLLLMSRRADVEGNNDDGERADKEEEEGDRKRKKAGKQRSWRIEDQLADSSDLSASLSKIATAMNFDHLSSAISAAVASHLNDCGAFLYSVDLKKQKMRPLFAGGVAGEEFERGILGCVATTGRVEVVGCASLHRCFDEVIDCHSLKEGTDCQPMCVMPLFDSNRVVVGLLQVVGKNREGEFSESEVNAIVGFSKNAQDGMQRCLVSSSLSLDAHEARSSLVRASEDAQALRKRLRQEGEMGAKERKRLLDLIKISRSLMLERDKNEVINAAEKALKVMLGCDRSVVFMKDEERGETVSCGEGNGLGGLEMRMDAGKGVVGHVCKTGKVVNIGDSGESGKDIGLDMTIGGEVNYGSDKRTSSLLCVPIWAPDKNNNSNLGERVVGDGRIMGCVLLQNREEAAGGGISRKSAFKGIDEALLKCFCDFLGVAIMVADLRQMSATVHSEFNGMANKIDELMDGGKAVEVAGDMMRLEEMTSASRNKALHSLFDIEKELDSQSAVIEALLH